MSTIDRIQQKVRDGDYFLSLHAEEEMIADGFDRADVENALLHGFLQKKLTRDPRGTRYIIEGPAAEGRWMQVVCRFHETGELIIITVYARG